MFFECNLKHDLIIYLIPSVPAAPKNVLEALEQRRAKYVEASTQAKASGDDRKARMHDRIAKVRWQQTPLNR